MGYVKLLSTRAKERVGKGLQRVQQLLLNHRETLWSGHLSIRKMKRNLLHPNSKSCILCKLLIVKFAIDIKVIYTLQGGCILLEITNCKVICI